MKPIAGILVFASTLALGVQIAAFADWANSGPVHQILAVVDEGTSFFGEPIAAERPSGIRVMYAGTKPATETEPAFLTFIVYNGTSGPVTYNATGGSSRPYPEVRVNDKVQVSSRYFCVSGMRQYTIQSGMSAEFHVGPDEFANTPNSRDLITVGFHLRDEYSDHAELIRSEPFQLPNDFRREMDNWFNKAKSQRAVFGE